MQGGIEMANTWLAGMELVLRRRAETRLNPGSKP